MELVEFCREDPDKKKAEIERKCLESGPRRDSDGRFVVDYTYHQLGFLWPIM